MKRTPSPATPAQFDDKDLFDRGISFWLLLAALVSGFFTGSLWFFLMPGFVPETAKWIISGITGIVTSIAYIQNERRPSPSLPGRYVFKFTTIGGALLITYAGINALKLQAEVRDIDVDAYRKVVESAETNLANGYLTATRRTLEAARGNISTEANIYDFFHFASSLGIPAEWLVLIFAGVLAASLDFALEILAKVKARLKNISGNSASPRRRNSAFGRKNSAENSAEADPDLDENSALLPKKFGANSAQAEEVEPKNRLRISAKTRQKICQLIHSARERGLIFANGKLNKSAVAREAGVDEKTVRRVMEEEGLA